MNLEGVKSAVQQVMDGTPVVVTKWITLVEVFDPADGQKRLLQICADDLTTWDAAGMLYIALHDEDDDDSA